ncbi:MAG: GNAT family N-acetyltransferase [Oscillospiraceae bacterium]|nr:GNAT family N-acetyltransferase [Oscillospiraceae bacterium]
MINHVGTQLIDTERLILRQFTKNDASDMFCNWVTDPEVSKFWGWKPHENIEETKSLLHGWIEDYKNPKTYHWVIELKSTSQAVGYIYLNEFDENDSCEVHFALSQKYWNQGFMTEACKAVLAFAFDVLHVEKVHTRHHIDNPASGRVMQKCGMKYIETVYKKVPDCEQISGDYCFYEISKDELHLQVSDADISYSFQDIKNHLDNNTIHKILSYCLFDGSPEGIAKDIEKYRDHNTWDFYGWVENGDILGICGFEVHADYVEILHIAVAEDARHRGIGGAMVTVLQEKYGLRIEAETDDDAVEFYRKTGFEANAFQKYNVQRYHCVLPATHTIRED